MFIARRLAIQVATFQVATLRRQSNFDSIPVKSRVPKDMFLRWMHILARIYLKMPDAEWKILTRYRPFPV